MLFAICLSTNTCVSVHNARELIMLSQQSSALQRREEKKGKEGGSKEGSFIQFALSHNFTKKQFLQLLKTLFGQ